METDISKLTDGDRVMLHPAPDNPLHKKPVMATFQSGYFYCDGSPFGDPDYYWRDVMLYNDGYELIDSK